MRSVEWLCCRWPCVTPLTTLNHLNFHILRCLMHLRNWWLQKFKFDVVVECASHSLRTTNCPWYGRGQVMLSIKNFVGSNHITGTAEPKIVTFCTQVGYISSSNRMTYHPQQGCGYGHVTVLKFCRLPWYSVLRALVSDSWIACKRCKLYLLSRFRGPICIIVPISPWLVKLFWR